jgi:hypothetical protein
MKRTSYDNNRIPSRRMLIYNAVDLLYKGTGGVCDPDPALF